MRQRQSSREHVAMGAKLTRIENDEMHENFYTNHFEGN